MANPDTPTFPYNNGGAPYTDGIIDGVNTTTGSVYIPSPSELTQSFDVPPEAPGRITDYIGNTQCVDTRSVQYNIFAGNF